MSLAAGSAAGVRHASLLLFSPASSSSRPLLTFPHQSRAYRSLASPAATRGSRKPRLQVRAARTESTGVSVGFRAPQFELPEPLTGKLWTLDDFEGSPALLMSLGVAVAPELGGLVLEKESKGCRSGEENRSLAYARCNCCQHVMFICNHCPFVKHLKKDIAKLTSFYMEKGLASVAISSNSIVTHPQDGPEYMAEEAKLFKYSFPYLYDEVWPQYALPDAVSVISPISINLLCFLFFVTTAPCSLKKLLRLFEQSARQNFTCSKRMDEGHLNFFTMASLMILDPVAMCQSPAGI